MIIKVRIILNFKIEVTSGTTLYYVNLYIFELIKTKFTLNSLFWTKNKTINFMK